MDISIEPVLDNYGFDPTASPEWVMVPLRGEKTLWLLNATGASVISTSTGIASASIEESNTTALPPHRILRIKGITTGRTFVEIRQNNRTVKRLEISVKPPVTLKVSFHFVSDGGNHSTNRSPGELDEMISLLNQIYTPQTNIIFRKKNYFPLKFNRNFGDAVNYNVDFQGRPIKGHEWESVVSKRDRSADINIFFVWKNEFVTLTKQGKLEIGGEALGYSVGGRDCLIEDWDGFMDRDNNGQADSSPAWETARMLAHEMGHILGIDDVLKTKKVRNPVTRRIEQITVNPNFVMGSGAFIPKNHANIMSAVARQIAGK